MWRDLWYDVRITLHLWQHDLMSWLILSGYISNDEVVWAWCQRCNKYHPTTNNQKEEDP